MVFSPFVRNYVLTDIEMEG